MFITGSSPMRDENNKLIKFVRNPFFNKLFTSYGDRLIYPVIYWYEGDYVIPYLEKIIEDKNVDMLIGYSAGGYPGYYLCNKYKLKGLHFNPAIAASSEAPRLQSLTDGCFESPVFGDQMMIIGERDRRNRGGVDAHLVLNFLDSVGFEDAGGEILIIPELEHRVPPSIFRMAFDYYMNR